MKVVVTGGAGFIGSHLVDRLIEDGHFVTVIDSLVGGQREFFEHHLSSSQFKFVKLDIRDTKRLMTVLSPEIEMVYHLAANADIALGVEDPTLDFEHSVVATFSLLQAMRYHGIKKLVYTSGSGVYGDRGQKYSSETFGPLEPVSMYGAAKLGAEGLISAFSHLFDMQAWIFRPANIIGPRATHGVVFDSVKRLKTDPTQLRILGDGKQSKAYLYITDVIDALIMVPKKIKRPTKQRVSFFNMSSNTYITVNDIAKAVAKEMHLPQVKFQHTGGSVGWKGDVAIVRLKNTAIRKLKWAPRYNSKQAVVATIRALITDPRISNVPQPLTRLRRQGNMSSIVASMSMGITQLQ